jgi:peptide/nickel transport system permease protein
MKKKQNKLPNQSNLLVDLFKKKPMGAAGLIIMVLLLLVAIFADYLAPYPKINGVMQMDYFNMLSKSSAEHLLGTDSLGQDVLSYLIYGCRTSVILAIACTLLSTVISVIIGISSAVIGGWFDLIVQRIVDGFQCIPGVLITMIMMSILGKGLPQLIMAIAIPSGIGGARIMRSAAFSVKDAGYVRMSKLLGSKTGWRGLKHVLPNTMPLIIVNMAGSISGVVMQEASMNFLGYGVAVGTPSWGYMITYQGRANMYTAPWLALYPGLCIMLLVFAANMFGDAIRDLLDPRLKGGVGSYSTKKITKIAAKIAKKRAKIASKAGAQNA